MGSAPLGAAGLVHAHGRADAGLAAGLQALAHVVLRDDGRARSGEGQVSAGVVAVVVGVDDEAHRLVGRANALERGGDLVGQRSVLVIDDDDAIFADRGGDVAARAFQHVDVAGNLGDLDLDLAEVLVLRRGKAAAHSRKKNASLRMDVSSPLREADYSINTRAATIAPGFIRTEKHQRLFLCLQTQSLPSITRPQVSGASALRAVDFPAGEVPHQLVRRLFVRRHRDKASLRVRVLPRTSISTMYEPNSAGSWRTSLGRS